MDPKEFDPDRVTHATPLQGAKLRFRAAYNRWRALNWPWRVLSIILLLIFAAWLTLYITKGRFLKGPAERIATSYLGREVQIGGDFQLYFDPITIKFRAENMRIANPEWAKDKAFFSALSIDARIATFPLIWGRRTFKQLYLDNGIIDLRWTQDGKANTWTFGSGPPKKLELPDIRIAAITCGCWPIAR